MKSSIAGTNLRLACVRRAAWRVAGARSSSRPPNSWRENSAAACGSQGRAAAIVAGVSRMPGAMSRTNARVAGSARSTAPKPRRRLVAVGPSRCTLSANWGAFDAVAATVVLKLLIRSRRSASLLASAPVVRAAPLISRDRSCSRWPSSPSWAIAESRRAATLCCSATFSACPPVSPWTSGSWSASSAADGVEPSASPRPLIVFCSDVRVSVCKAVRIWSSWTGVEVCATGIMPPSSTSSVDGVPGFMST